MHSVLSARLQAPMLMKSAMLAVLILESALRCSRQAQGSEEGKARIKCRSGHPTLMLGRSCFQKDIFNIVYLSESLHLYQVADYWRSIITMNEHQKDRFTKRIISCLFNTLRGKKIAVLGFAFKKDTSDTRESPAITMVSNLIVEGAQIGIYDPQVEEEQIWNDLLADGVDPLKLRSSVDICQSPYDACSGADAVVVMTEWDEFSNKTGGKPAGSLLAAPRSFGLKHDLTTTAELNLSMNQAHLHTPPKSPPLVSKAASHESIDGYSARKLAMVSIKARTGARDPLDWARVSRSMKKPMFVFDGRNITDSAELEKLGFRVETIGKAGVAFGRARDSA